jgi:hypothetical protein
MKPVRTLLMAASTLLLWTGTASASPCTISTLGLQAFAAVGWTGGGGGENNDAGCVVNGDSASPVVNEASSQHAHAFATTAYGINSASVSGSLTPTGGTANAFAWSIWTDTILITGGAGTGEVTFGSHVTGSFTNHTTTSFTLAINQGAGGNFTGFSTTLLYAEMPVWTPDFSYDVTLPYVFTYDVPFTLTAWLDLSGTLNSLCCGGIDAQPPFSADFSHTAILDTVILPAGASLDALWGTYPAQAAPAPVPEPTTLALLGLGLARLGFRRRQRARRGRGIR